MRKLLLIIAGFIFIMFGLSNTVQADESTPYMEGSTSGLGKTVRTDRYWLYLYTSGRFAIPETTSRVMRSEFTDPVELEGKIYHTFHTEQIDIKVGEEKLIFPDYYLREENGVVYLNLKHGFNIDSAQNFFEEQNEIPLYDFNLKLYSQFKSVAMPDAAICGLNNGGVPSPEPYTYVVAHINNIEIMGEDCLVYTLVGSELLPEYNPDDYLKYERVEYIEGIGMVKASEYLDWQYVFIPFNCYYLVLPTGGFSYESHCGLIGVYDKKDNLIYKGDAELTPSGIADICVSDSTPATYYNLQGTVVPNPERGQLYIRIDGNRACKIIY